MEGGYGFLLDLALILLSTKLLGLLTQRFQLPQVVGALLAGLILGPAVLNVIQETEFIKDTAEIGVIVMMFCAGMETDVNELKHSGKAAFIIALIGVLVPIGGGFALAYFFNQPGVIESDATTPVFLQNMFIGVILTATSVSISVETLKELGKLNPLGQRHFGRGYHRRRAGHHRLDHHQQHGRFQREHLDGAAADFGLLRLCGGGRVPVL